MGWLNVSPHLSSHAVCLVIKLAGVRTGHSYLVFFVDLFYDMHCHLLKLFFFQFQVRIIENTNVKRKPFYNTPSKQLTPWCCTSQDLASRAVLGIYIVLLNLSGGQAVGLLASWWWKIATNYECNHNSHQFQSKLVLTLIQDNSHIIIPLLAAPYGSLVWKL